MEELVNFWLALNHRISAVVAGLDEAELNLVILLDEEEKSDLRFLITDYVDHMAYHIEQVIE